MQFATKQIIMYKTVRADEQKKEPYHLDMTLSVLFYHFTLTGFLSLISVPKNYSNINYT